MLLLSSLSRLSTPARSEDSHANNGVNGKTEFPTGHLTSTAWEGWWHDDAA